MNKNLYSLGLMSGTSGDGIDASIIQSDGDSKYKVILDKYFEYSKDICHDLFDLRDRINNSNDLKNLLKETEALEKKITLFHAKAVKEIINDSNINVDLIGFHGQTIFHSFYEKISKQLGDGKLLAELSKKTVICNFRQNDLLNGGAGAPLAPIFHKLLIKQYKIKLPIIILNLGGIANMTWLTEAEMSSADVGPGNCLIDQWMKKNSKEKYDKDGSTAQSGKINKIILDQAVDKWRKKFSDPNYVIIKSYDTKDFDLSFVRGLSLEDGAATLTEYTAQILSDYFNHIPKVLGRRIIVCGGGRKNKFLLKRISEKIEYNLIPTENFGINGDFVESQAFAYLAIRSYLKKFITFPSTTGVRKPCLGGLTFKS